MGDKVKQEDIKDCFNLYDNDGSGKIPSEKLGTVLRSLGHNPTEAEVEDMVRNIRGPAFGMPDLVQASSKCAKESKNSPDEIREAFSVFDRDGCGRVSAAELRHVMTTTGEKLSDKEFDDLIRVIDVDRDGQITYEEIVRLMCIK